MSTGVTEKELFEIIRRQSEQIDGLTIENKVFKAEIAYLKKRMEELERWDSKYTAPSNRKHYIADPKLLGCRLGEGWIGKT